MHNIERIVKICRCVLKLFDYLLRLRLMCILLTGQVWRHWGETEGSYENKSVFVCPW